ncbi:MAG TPA: restriction endonuclease subunit S [Methanosarcina thermophila]|nr:restriction endonuclease subunit S [Methanosarcina thermophila]HPZ20398.1 restriction endonuclease subunit S [Methanosarcina thermophila]HQD94788.1 restriction endonuclease subunit S [Methanosarcina thermophila]
MTKEKFESLSAFEIFPGDIVITMMGTIGDCMVVPEKISKGIMNSHLMRLQLKSNVTPEYLAILITDAFFVKKQINRLSQGAIMSGLNSKIIKQIFIPLPSINEQRKLVEICKKISDASAEEINYLTKLKELKKGLMQDLLTGKVRVCV